MLLRWGERLQALPYHRHGRRDTRDFPLFTRCAPDLSEVVGMRLPAPPPLAGSGKRACHRSPTHGVEKCRAHVSIARRAGARYVSPMVVVQSKPHDARLHALHMPRLRRAPLDLRDPSVMIRKLLHPVPEEGAMSAHAPLLGFGARTAERRHSVSTRGVTHPFRDVRGRSTRLWRGVQDGEARLASCAHGIHGGVHVALELRRKMSPAPLSSINDRKSRRRVRALAPGSTITMVKVAPRAGWWLCRGQYHVLQGAHRSQRGFAASTSDHRARAKDVPRLLCPTRA